MISLPVAQARRVQLMKQVKLSVKVKLKLIMTVPDLRREEPMALFTTLPVKLLLI